MVTVFQKRSRAGEMSLWARMLAVQVGGPEFGSLHPGKQPDISAHKPATPALWWAGTGGLLGLNAWLPARGAVLDGSRNSREWGLAWGRHFRHALKDCNWAEDLFWSASCWKRREDSPCHMLPPPWSSAYALGTKRPWPVTPWNQGPSKNLPCPELALQMFLP